MKLVTVVGARPQFIKAAAVSRAIAAHNLEMGAKGEQIEELIVHTGQHFDTNMSDIFFNEMEIPRPHYSLGINSLNHGAMTGRMLEKIEEVLSPEKPDFVLVYGDTNSTLAGALAAKKLQIKVVHVEAGLRSFNMAMPEEVNRIVTDRIADVLCCPTGGAVENLVREGFENFPCKIVKTGDVMFDAALYYSAISTEKSDIAQRLDIEDKPFALCTMHRAENTDCPRRMASIIGALNDLSKEIAIVMPLHPRTQSKLRNTGERLDFHPIAPVGYFDMLELLKRTKVVLTDSGGLQKEAFFFKKFCISLRDETEWTELVDNECNYLAGAQVEQILQRFHEIDGKAFPNVPSLYGDGNSAGIILNAMMT
jgi:UDP-GlcNAc3NAcA epimerase